jgi:hypothetical protein
MVQFNLDQLLDRITLHDLVNSEQESGQLLRQMLEQKPDTSLLPR